MRIAQTTDGRFIKVLSPELRGLIGRLYQEVKERKEKNLEHDTIIGQQGNELSLVESKVDMLLLRYSELSSMLDSLFPDDEDFAVIDRPLIVNNRVTGLQFISEIVSEPPLVVASSMMVTNLNAHYIGGRSVDQLAPIEHVGAGGTDQHPEATVSLAGFLGTGDKTKLDSITIGYTAPSNPKPGDIWFDLNP